MTRAIGIDLGTTYTVVATIEGERPKVIPNAEGLHLTPSVVTFSRTGGLLVGGPAVLQAGANPDGTVFSIKRRMGSDTSLTLDGREFTPPQISSFILRKVKADAEHYLGEKIDQAVITVPAYFNDRQRQATKEAGVLADLDVLRLTNEPTAAALAYGIRREEAQTVLVWDLGGGTFDVSILELGDGVFQVRAVSGDTALGGDDFDERVADYLADQYQKLLGVGFPGSTGARHRLKQLSEQARIALSSSSLTRVDIPMFGPPEERRLAVDLTRGQLESLSKDLLQRMVTATAQALADAGFSPADIDRVILVGGVTRMPAVRALARRLLGKEPYRYIEPDEVVAQGAAIQAGMLLGPIKNVALLDVLPLSLGIATQGGLTARIIPRNTPLPASGARVFTTAADSQASMDIQVFQGERELAVDNVFLGRSELTGIPPTPRGVPRVEIAFQADEDGIIHLTATELLTGSQVDVKMVSTKLLDATEIASMAAEAEAKRGEDRANREGVQTRIQAENLIAAAKTLMEELLSLHAHADAENLATALARLQNALAHGTTAEIRRLSSQARQLLMALNQH